MPPRLRVSTIPRANPNDIREYLGLAFELSRVTPSKPVVKYALTRVSRAELGEYSWASVSDLLIPAAIMEPSCLDLVSRILSTATAESRNIDLEGVEAGMNDIARHHAPLEHGSVVAWTLWVLIERGLAIDAETYLAIALMDDPTCQILLRYAQDQGLTGNHELPESVVERASSAESLTGRDWMLAYEFAAHGWIPEANARCHPFFATLLDAGVRFFQPSQTIATVRVPRTGGQIDSLSEFLESGLMEVSIPQVSDADAADIGYA